MTENEIQKSIIDFCKRAGFLVFRMNVNRQHYNIKGLPEGTPDLLVIDNRGRTFWIEVKNGKGKLRDKQKQMHNKLREHKQRVAVCRSLEDFIDEVEYD